MDYELMMNGNVRIGMKAPEFDAQTTMGNILLFNKPNRTKSIKNM